MISAFFFYTQKYLLRIIFFFLFPLRRRKNRCVVLNRADHLGDILCSIPSLNEFCRYFQEQGYHVVLMVKPEYRWFVEKLIPFDRIIPVDRNKTYESLFYRYSIFLQLYSLKIEKFITYIETDSAGYLTAWSGAKEIHQVRTFLIDRPFFRRINASITHIHPVNAKESVFRQYEEFVSQITGRPFHTQVPDLRPVLPAAASSTDKDCRYYLIFPGASVYSHCWQPGRFAELLRRIHARFPDLQPVLAGSSGDLPLCEAILAALPDEIHCRSLCGKTPLADLFLLTANARFVIGNDSGGIHLAAVLRVPAFAILHGASFGLFLPNGYYENTVYLYNRMPCFSCGENCKGNDTTPPCLLSISVDQVASPVLEFLTAQEMQSSGTSHAS